MTPKHDDVAKGKIRVFVYGTLKEGRGNHSLLKSANAQFVGYDAVTGPIQMIDMVGFPGLYRPAAAGGENVQEATPFRARGEVWAIDPEGLAALDYLEGHPTFYRREKWWTEGGVRAWVYLLSPQTTLRAISRGWLEDKKEIPEGIWNPSDEELEHWEAA